MFIHNQYAAGFFDGEGTINFSCLHRIIRRNRNKKLIRNRSTDYYEWSVRCSISNTVPQVLYKFQEKWGGTVMNGSGYTRIHTNRKPLYQWKAASNQAEIFIRDIYPYLIIKKEIADLFLEFRKTMNKPGTKGISNEIIKKRLHIIELAHQINQRGLIPVKPTPLIKTNH